MLALLDNSSTHDALLSTVLTYNCHFHKSMNTHTKMLLSVANTQLTSLGFVKIQRQHQTWTEKEEESLLEKMQAEEVELHKEE